LRSAVRSRLRHPLASPGDQSSSPGPHSSRLNSAPWRRSDPAHRHGLGPPVDARPAQPQHRALPRTAGAFRPLRDHLLAPQPIDRPGTFAKKSRSTLSCPICRYSSPPLNVPRLEFRAVLLALLAHRLTRSMQWPVANPRVPFLGTTSPYPRFKPRRRDEQRRCAAPRISPGSFCPRATPKWRRLRPPLASALYWWKGLDRSGAGGQAAGRWHPGSAPRGTRDTGGGLRFSDRGIDSHWAARPAAAEERSPWKRKPSWRACPTPRPRTM